MGETGHPVTSFWGTLSLWVSRAKVEIGLHNSWDKIGILLDSQLRLTGHARQEEEITGKFLLEIGVGPTN